MKKVYLIKQRFQWYDGTRSESNLWVVGTWEEAIEDIASQNKEREEEEKECAKAGKPQFYKVRFYAEIIDYYYKER